MCYINGIRISRLDYIRYKQHQKELMHLNRELLHQPARRGFDYSDWPVIKPSADGLDWEAVAMNWGFLPDSVTTVEQAQQFRYGFTDKRNNNIPPCTTLLARGEELLMPGKIYRQAALHRRCLVLSSGFYEHRSVRGTGAKYPYRITMRERGTFFMAGIYNTFFDDESGEAVDTMALITTDATGNALMEKIHDKKRMPVILPEQLAEEWTNNNLSEQRIRQLATHQLPAEMMAAYTVSKDFLTSDDPAAGFIYPELSKAA